jgi:replication-associated recombination protein RarA
MALAMAEEMKAELHLIPSQKCTAQAIEDVRRMCQYAPMFGCAWHLVVVDEVDSASNAAQLALLSKLDATDPAPNTVWVFTSNFCDKLEKRFLSRCRVIEFSNYGMRSDLASFLAKVWESETGQPGQLNWERIAKDSTSNVRAALSALEMELLAA